MNHRLAPTPFTDVNFVLDHFRSQLQVLLGSELVGIYLVGSLALGDFNLRSSDIDFVVVTSTEIDPDRFTALQHVHAQFAASSSPWRADFLSIVRTEDKVSLLEVGAETGQDGLFFQKGGLETVVTDLSPENASSR